MDHKDSAQSEYETVKAEKRVCLGRIHSAHGVRGLVKILPYGDDPKLIETLGPIYVSESGEQALEVTMKSAAGQYWLASIDDIADRDQAEDLKGTELFQLRSKLPEIDDDDSFYYDDLIGLKVMDGEGKEIGKVLSVQNYGASDLLEIKPLRGDDFLLPFSKETVPDIDFDNGCLTAIIPEGLLD